MLRFLRLMCLFAAVVALGCQPKANEREPADANAVTAEQELHVVVLDDAPLAGAIRSEWESRGEGAIEVREAASAEWLAQPTAADLFVFPATLTGDFVNARKLDWLTTKELGGGYMIEDIHFQVRAGTMSWEDRLIAAPFGSPHPVLMYRADLLQAADVEVPGSWGELESVKRLLEQQRSQWDPSGKALVLAEPLGRPGRPGGFAAAALLVRAAAYAADSNQDSVLWSLEDLTSRIDSPPFVRALEDLAKCWPDAAAPLDLTPEEALRKLYGGQAAMALTWPTQAVGQDTADAPYLDKIRFALPPGSDERFDWRSEQWTQAEDGLRRVPVIALAGRVAALARSAANKNAAASLLSWLTGPQASAQVAPASSYSAPFRNTHREVAGRWVGPILSRDAAVQYYDVLETLHGRGPALSYPRVPGWPILEAAIDQAVVNVLQGRQSAPEALAEAADVWNQHLKTLNQSELRQFRTLLRQSLP